MPASHSTAEQRSATKMALMKVDVFDDINLIEYLVECLFMACGSIGDRTQVNALQYLCEKVSRDIIELETKLGAL